MTWPEKFVGRVRVSKNKNTVASWDPNVFQLSLRFPVQDPIRVAPFDLLGFPCIPLCGVYGNNEYDVCLPSVLLDLPCDKAYLQKVLPNDMLPFIGLEVDEGNGTGGDFDAMSTAGFSTGASTPRQGRSTPMSEASGQDTTPLSAEEGGQDTTPLSAEEGGQDTTPLSAEEGAEPSHTTPSSRIAGGLEVSGDGNSNGNGDNGERQQQGWLLTRQEEVVDFDDAKTDFYLSIHSAPRRSECQKFLCQSMDEVNMMFHPWMFKGMEFTTELSKWAEVSCGLFGCEGVSPVHLDLIDSGIPFSSLEKRTQSLHDQRFSPENCQFRLDPHHTCHSFFSLGKYEGRTAITFHILPTDEVMEIALSKAMSMCFDLESVLASLKEFEPRSGARMEAIVKPILDTELAKQQKRFSKMGRRGPRSAV